MEFYIMIDLNTFFVFIIIATFIFQKYKTNEILTKSKLKRQEILKNLQENKE